MPPSTTPTDTEDDAESVARLYRNLLDAWNRRDAAAFAALFADDAHVVGFDGSQMQGTAEIQTVLGGIFARHKTLPYVAIVRGVGFPSADVAILRAVVGMVPHGSASVKPEVNAIQSLVAARRGGRWLISLFQNTPAQFHGRPEVAEALSRELDAQISRTP